MISPSLLFRHRSVLVALGIVLAAHIASFTYMANLAAGNPSSAPYPVLAGDGETYAALADSLIESGGFTGSGFETERHWPPGYSALLAVTKWVSGGFYLAVVLQVFLALLAVYLIYLMALKFLPPLWATVPALLYGLDPNVVLANTTILSDSLFSSLFVVAVYVAFFTKVRREWARWGAVALLLATATLIRPIAQFLVLLAPLALCTALYLRGVSLRSLAVPLASYALVVFIVLAPWLMWVHERHAAWEVSHVGASNLLYYNARDFLAWKEMKAERNVPAVLATRYRDDPAYERVDARIVAELSERTPEGKASANYEGAVATRFILEDPLRYTYFHFVNTAPFFLASSIASYKQVVVQVRDGTGYFAPTALALIESAKAILSGDLTALARTAPVALEVLFWAGACILALFGVWRNRYDIAILASVVLVAYFAILTGPVSIARYRIPVEPYLLLLAVIGAHMLYQRIRKRL